MASNPESTGGAFRSNKYIYVYVYNLEYLRWLRTLNLLVEPAGLMNASINFIIYCLAGTRLNYIYLLENKI